MIGRGRPSGPSVRARTTLAFLVEGLLAWEPSRVQASDPPGDGFRGSVWHQLLGAGLVVDPHLSKTSKWGASAQRSSETKDHATFGPISKVAWFSNQPH